MNEKQHHPSCSPHDRDLVWHCYQCGLNESAQEIEDELDALKASIADLSHPNCQQLLKDVAAEKKVADLRLAVIKDDCETDTNIRELARPILGDYKVDGDSYGVPGLEDIVEELIKMLTAEQAKVKK